LERAAGGSSFFVAAQLTLILVRSAQPVNGPDELRDLDFATDGNFAIFTAGRFAAFKRVRLAPGEGKPNARPR
jgi:hypothetical protein